MTDQLTGLDDPDDVEPGAAADAGDPALRDGDADTADEVGDETADSDTPRARVSKWDRPPEPRDWRFWVGGLGKVLIATGLLMFGFVAYQLWGTGIETARAQSSLEDAFQDAVATTAGALAEPAATSDDAPESDGAGPDADPNVDESAADVDDPAADGAAGDDGDPPGIDEPALVEPGADETPTDPEPSTVVPGGVDLSDQAVDQDLPPVVAGEALARLQIPKIGKDLYVVPGVRVDDLKKGPGHYPDTPLPGQLGNAAIAGHRTTYGEPFFDVDQLAAGDELIVTMRNGDTFVYVVTGVEIVGADDYWVVTTRDPTVAELTLTSCHPKYTARDRIVVHSVLDPEASARVGLPTFYDLEAADDDDGATIPGDDPVVTAPDEAATDDGAIEPSDDAADDSTAADDGDDEPTGPASDETPAPADDPADPAGDAVAEPTDEADDGFSSSPTGEPEDAFARGWFHDDGAFPQVALWGVALTAIALGAYALSRRFRHDSVGLLVGIVPFVVALYFFFQNVNRLLPPGL